MGKNVLAAIITAAVVLLIGGIRAFELVATVVAAVIIMVVVSGLIFGLFLSVRAGL